MLPLATCCVATADVASKARSVVEKEAAKNNSITVGCFHRWLIWIVGEWIMKHKRRVGFESWERRCLSKVLSFISNFFFHSFQNTRWKMKTTSVAPQLFPPSLSFERDNPLLITELSPFFKPPPNEGYTHLKLFWRLAYFNTALKQVYYLVFNAAKVYLTSSNKHVMFYLVCNT